MYISGRLGFSDVVNWRLREASLSESIGLAGDAVDLLDKRLVKCELSYETLVSTIQPRRSRLRLPILSNSVVCTVYIEIVAEVCI